MDNDNHLYAISRSAGKLFVVTITSTGYRQAAGSPYAVTSPQSKCPAQVGTLAARGPPSTTRARKPVGSLNSLPIGLFDVLAGLLGKRCAVAFGEDSLILLHRQLTLLEDVIHFAGGQVGFLKCLSIGIGSLANQFVGGRSPRKVFLAAEEISQGPRGYLVMQAAVLPFTTVLPDFAIAGCCFLGLTGGAEKIGFLQRE